MEHQPDRSTNAIKTLEINESQRGELEKRKRKLFQYTQTVLEQDKEDLIHWDLQYFLRRQVFALYWALHLSAIPHNFQRNLLIVFWAILVFGATCSNLNSSSCSCFYTAVWKAELRAVLFQFNQSSKWTACRLYSSEQLEVMLSIQTFVLVVCERRTDRETEWGRNRWNTEQNHIQSIYPLSKTVYPLLLF